MDFNSLFNADFISLLSYFIVLLIAYIFSRILHIESFKTILIFHSFFTILFCFLDLIDFFYLFFALIEVILVFKLNTNANSGESINE